MEHTLESVQNVCETETGHKSASLARLRTDGRLNSKNFFLLFEVKNVSHLVNLEWLTPLNLKTRMPSFVPV